MIDAKQIRAARALLRWSQEDLAGQTNVSLQTIKNIENEKTLPHLSSIESIRENLEIAGIEFLDRSGVRLRGEEMRVYKGPKALDKFFLDLYATMAADEGGEYTVFGVEEKKFWDEDADATNQHIERIKKHGSITCRALIAEGDNNQPSPHIAYAALDKQHFSSVPFYVFKDKLAFIVWGPPAQIFVIENKALAEAYKKQFAILWNAGTKIG